MRYLLIFVFVLCGLIVISDEFELIDLTSRSRNFEKIIGERVNSRVIIDGGIVLKVLPTPRLEIINFKALDQDTLVFSTDKITLDIGFNELINGFANLNKVSITMNEALLNTSDFHKYLAFSKGKYEIEIKIKKADIDIHQGYMLKNELSISNLLFSSTSSGIITSGEFNLNNQKIGYNLEFSDNKNISLNINNDGFSFYLNLNDFDRTNLSIKDGKIDFKLKKIDNLLQFIFPEYKPDPVLKSQDKALEYNLNLSGDLIMDINREITLQNVDINSNFIEGVDIKFRLYQVMDHLLESYLYLSADKINLSYIKDIIAGDIEVNDLLKNLLSTSRITESINLNLNFDIKKLVLNSGQINNCFLSTYNILDRIIIDRLDIDLPGDSKLNFNGLISGNEIRQKINGVLQVESDDKDSLMSWYSNEQSHNKEKKKLKFGSRIFGMQNLIKISQYYLEVDEAKLQGNAYLYEIPYEAPVKIILADGSNINFDDLGFVSQWDNYIMKLYDADADKSGEEYFKLTKANSWIRSFDKNLYLNINLRDTIVRKEKIAGIRAVLNISANELDVKYLKIRNDKIDGEVKLKFVLPVLRPQLTTDLNFKTLDLQYGINLFMPNPDDATYDLQKLNFFSANNYDGNLKFKVDNLIISETINPTLVNGEANLKFGYLLVPKLQYSLWNGQFDVNGSVLLSSNKPTFECTASIYNIDPKEIFNKITGVDKITGYMSLAGSLKGDLTKWDDFNKISGQVDFLGAQITWNGFNLNKVVEAVDGQYTKDSKLQAVEYYSQYGSTIFDFLKGSMIIKNGVVNINNGSMSDKRLAGSFNVNYSLASKNLNSASSFAFIPAGSSKTLTMNFKTSGSIANPTDNTVDYNEVSNFVSGASKN